MNALHFLLTFVAAGFLVPLPVGGLVALAAIIVVAQSAGHWQYKGRE